MTRLFNIIINTINTKLIQKIEKKWIHCGSIECMMCIYVYVCMYGYNLAHRPRISNPHLKISDVERIAFSGLKFKRNFLFLWNRSYICVINGTFACFSNIKVDWLLHYFCIYSDDSLCDLKKCIRAKEKEKSAILLYLLGRKVIIKVNCIINKKNRDLTY